MKKPKKKNDKTLKRKADELHSKVVRLFATDERGYITCYCGAVVPWTESDCSHYHSRQYLSVRYSFKNTKASCRRCNRFQGGNLAAFALALEKEYGTGILQELETEKRKIIKLDYQTIIEERKSQLALLTQSPSLI